MAAAFRTETLQVLGPVTAIAENVQDFDLSRAGRLVYLSTPGYGGQLAWVDRQGTTEPFSDLDQRLGRPRLSPDGSRVAVEIIRGARSDIGIYDFGRRTLTLMTTDGVSNSPAWHPDGRRLVFRGPRGLRWQSADSGEGSEDLLAVSAPGLQSANSLAPGVFSADDGASEVRGIFASPTCEERPISPTRISRSARLPPRPGRSPIAAVAFRTTD